MARYQSWKELLFEIAMVPVALLVLWGFVLGLLFLYRLLPDTIGVWVVIGTVGFLVWLTNRNEPWQPT